MAQISTRAVDPHKRRLLTPKNMQELGITPALMQKILESRLSGLRRNKVSADKKEILVNKKTIPLFPIGISINEKIFGDFPNPNAAQRGWMAYFEIGAPLIEERSNIVQPPADILSSRSFENRRGIAQNFSDTLEFSVGNTMNWSLTTNSNFTFGGRISGELQAQIAAALQMSISSSLSNALAVNAETSVSTANHLHAHKDNMGTQTVITSGAKANTTGTTNNTNIVSGSGTFTGTGSAKGTGELSAQKGFGLSGTISGTVTTTWRSTSNVSGILLPSSRVETIASQRRQVKEYIYEFPINFGGVVAVHYEELVAPLDLSSPVTKSAPASRIIPVPINRLELIEASGYRAKAVVEKVSALDVNHIIFEEKSIAPDSKEGLSTARPHNL